MKPATKHGRLFAESELRDRRVRNALRPAIDNSAVPAGSPIYLDCLACGEPIFHNEDYLTRQSLCDECAALQALGWLS